MVSNTLPGVFFAVCCRLAPFAEAVCAPRIFVKTDKNPFSVLLHSPIY